MSLAGASSVGASWRALLVLASVAGVVTFARRADAQACCAGAAASEFGIVGRDDVSLVGMRVRAEHLPWTANADGEVRALEDARVNDYVFELGGGVRPFGLRLQLQGLVSLRLQERAFGERDEMGAGFGDASFYARYAVLFDDKLPALLGGSWLPFLEPYLGARFPTGRPPSEAELATLADATGAGSYALLAGVRATRALTHDDTLLASFGYGHSFSHDIEVGQATYSGAPGDDWSLGLAWFHAFGPRWLLGTSAGVRGATDARLDGSRVTDSSRHRIALGADLSYMPEQSGFQFRLGGMLEPPIDHFAKNEPFLGFAVALAAEYHFTARTRPSTTTAVETLRAGSSL